MYDKKSSCNNNLLNMPTSPININSNIPNTPNIDSNMNSPSRWRKITNVIRSVKSFCRYDTKNIGNDVDIDKDLEDYKERLHNNTIKNRDDFMLDYSQDKILYEADREHYNENLKEQVLNYIQE